VVKLIGSDFTQQGLDLVNDCAKGGTISDFLKIHGTSKGGNEWIATSSISQKLAFRIMRELADGLKQIRDHNVPHSDLENENLLLMGDPESWESEDPLVTFAIFGPSSKSARQEGNDVRRVFVVMMQVASLAEDGAAFKKAIRRKYRKLTMATDYPKSEDLVKIVKELELMDLFAAADSDSDSYYDPSAAKRGCFEWFKQLFQ
jgi:serine/threonine protein kinase